MKLLNRIMLVFTLALWIFLMYTPSAIAGETRASHLGAFACGMAKIMHMDEFLRDYPGSRTAVLCYLKLDSVEVYPMVKSLRTHSGIQDKMGRDFWPQIPIETYDMSLSEFSRELERQGSVVNLAVRTLAREIARYRDSKKWFFIRPFSEMNDGTESCPWEFANKRYANTPQDLAKAWILLRDMFDHEGATNAIFIFSPLAANRVHGEKQVLTALNLIPSGYIDAFGLNVYARPKSAYGGTSPDPIPFEELVQPWLKVLATSKQRGLPLAVSEMGVSNQATDDRRARWLKDAFAFARSHGFVTITYYNYPHPYWQIDDNTLAGEALRTGINQL